MYDNLFQQTREFLIINAGNEPIWLRYDGEEIPVPSATNVVSQGRWMSGRDSEGNLIPGTVILRDIYGPRGCPDDTTGNARGPMWDAGACIVHCLGIDPITRATTGKLADKGVGMLPLKPTPEIVEKTRAELVAKYKVFKRAWAKDVIEAYQTRANKHQAMGMSAGLPEEDYYEARKLTKEAEIEHEQKLKAMGLNDDLGIDTSDALLEAARNLAKSVAKDTPNVNIPDLVDRILKDKEIMRELRVRADVKVFTGRGVKKEKEADSVESTTSVEN